MFDLTGKTAIITGAASGIGKAIAILFARRGANVFIIDLDDKESQKTVDEILTSNGRAVYKKCNIGNAAEVVNTILEIVNTYSSIDILVNNAGIAHVGTVESTTEADFDRLFSVNVKGVFNMVKTAIPHMKEKGGSILNLASVAGIVGIPDRFAYTMTKSAVAGMTLSIAKDYLKHNIRCNSISPARVHTPFVDGFISKNYPGQEDEMFKKLSATQPIGRMGRPDEIAYLALYLCSDEASFITGCDYPIDGGFTRLNN
jgi:2-keto-3-deoxy-L-fuconate dehydrogenase